MLRIFSLLIVLVALTQCSSDGAFLKDKTLIYSEYNKGAYSSASTLIDKALKAPGLLKDQEEWLMIRRAMIDRTRLDFSKSEEQVRSQLLKYFAAIPDSLLIRWENSGHLEMRLIDNTKRYFNNAVPNLFRLDTAAARIRRNQTGIRIDPLDSINIENTAAIIETGKPGMPAETRKITIEYSISVDADAAPAGVEISCWLPFPRESAPRQHNVAVLSSNPEIIVQSAKDCLHSSLYAVKKAIAGKPTIFSYKASFEISGQWFNPLIIPSDVVRKVPVELLEYTKEVPPHLVFTQTVRHLADSLAGGGTDPFKMIRSFYFWIDKNIPWASALEYSTFECIPDYVLNQRHGDCGMKTFLLMSMARYKGIPARWQSGWMLHPGQENLHDWCELWFAKTGWIPVDIFFGLQSIFHNFNLFFYSV